MKGMKKMFLLGIFLLVFAMVGCQTQEMPEENYETSSNGIDKNAAIGDAAEESEDIEEKVTETINGEEKAMYIKIEANGNTIMFELNNSQAAQDLYAQLPLTTENEDFSNNEKTFYPPQKLNVSDAPHTDGSIGTLAYYEPWGDVVIFYGNYNPNDALYELGKVSSGSEHIENITGEITISAVEE